MQLSASSARRLVEMAASIVFVCVFAGAERDNPSLMRVEEDWELKLGSPDTKTSGPQVVVAFSPTGNLESVYATLEVNHCTEPETTPGGVHLQIWAEEGHFATRHSRDSRTASQSSESIRWTQAMEVKDGKLTFEILNANSNTWGDFDEEMRVCLSTNLENLDSYDAEQSLKHSGVPYAGNRVQTLVLKRIRVTTSDGQVWVYTTDAIVHGSQN